MLASAKISLTVLGVGLRKGNLCPMPDMMPDIPLPIQDIVSGTLISIGRNGIAEIKSPIENLPFGSIIMAFLPSMVGIGSASITTESSSSLVFAFSC